MDRSNKEQVFSVGQVVSLINDQLSNLYPLCVQGEISEFKLHSSGHWYFTIKDRDAQLRCAMWKTYTWKARIKPRVGLLVKLHGRLEVYGKTGSMSFIADTIEDSGEGFLYEEFLKLKSKLEAQGLFDEEIKKPIERIPSRIGIITSLEAAALQDVLNRLKQRAPYVDIDIYPASVQGEGAAQTLIDAIRKANLKPTDKANVLLLVRGGGSLQDLWCFNDERLVHAIRDSLIPIIAGIGHETDVTLSDLAADLRAPTPTAAAEAAAEKRDVLLSELESCWRPILLTIGSKMNGCEQDLVHYSAFFEDSSSLLLQYRRNLDLVWTYKSFPWEKFERNFSDILEVTRSLLKDWMVKKEQEINSHLHILKLEATTKKRDVLQLKLDSCWKSISFPVVTSMDRYGQDLAHFSVFHGGVEALLSQRYKDLDLVWTVQTFPWENFGGDFSEVLGTMKSFLSDRLQANGKEIVSHITWLGKEVNSKCSVSQQLFTKTLKAFGLCRPSIESYKVRHPIEMVSQYAALKIKSNVDRLDIANRALTMLDPRKLRSGMAFIFKDGKNITSVDQLKSSDLIRVLLSDGSFDARVGTVNRETPVKNKDN